MGQHALLQPYLFACIAKLVPAIEQPAATTGCTKRCPLSAAEVAGRGINTQRRKAQAVEAQFGLPLTVQKEALAAALSRLRRRKLVHTLAEGQATRAA